MKRKIAVTATAVLLCSSIFFTSCIGSFSLFKKLSSWNNTVGDSWTNELVFVVLCIVPAYEIALVIDIFVLNSVEFWTGDNPAQVDTQTKQIETENGLFTITTDENGHKIQKAGSDEIVEFRFNKEENSWSLVSQEHEISLFQYMGENQAKVFLADGSTMTVDLNQAGIMALRQVVENKAYFATK
jgi:hypothetical protein